MKLLRRSRLKYEAKVTHKTLMIKKCDRCHWKGVSLCTHHRLMTQKTLTRTNWSYNSAKLPIDRNKNRFYIKGCVFFACSMICREIMLQKDYCICLVILYVIVHTVIDYTNYLLHCALIIVLKSHKRSNALSMSKSRLIYIYFLVCRKFRNLWPNEFQPST